MPAAKRAKRPAVRRRSFSPATKWVVAAWFFALVAVGEGYWIWRGESPARDDAKNKKQSSATASDRQTGNTQDRRGSASTRSASANAKNGASSSATNSSGSVARSGSRDSSPDTARAAASEKTDPKRPQRTPASVAGRAASARPERTPQSARTPIPLAVQPLSQQARALATGGLEAQAAPGRAFGVEAYTQEQIANLQRQIQSQTQALQARERQAAEAIQQTREKELLLKQQEQTIQELNLRLTIFESQQKQQQASGGR